MQAFVLSSQPLTLFMWISFFIVGLGVLGAIKHQPSMQDPEPWGLFGTLEFIFFMWRFFSYFFFSFWALTALGFKILGP